MELSVVNTKGQDTGRKVSLPAEVFGVEPNQHAMYLDVKQYLANQRQGTHKSKERNEVAGSTKKIKKQKGTGGARAGSLKAPLFVGGGRVFGPRPRTYGFKLNKKLKSLARISALSLKAKESKLSLLDAFTVDQPKTKEVLNLLSSLQLSTTKTLFITADINTNFVLSSRNLKKVKVVNVDNLTTYDLLNAERLVLLEDSVNKLEALYSNK